MHPGKNLLTLTAWVAIGLAIAAARAEAQRAGIANTKHNLAASGPGAGRAAAGGQGRVCVFCHSPHSRGRMVPLWNRETSRTVYKIYESSTLDARPGQPTGASKLCLSCHDGTIALSAVLPRPGETRLGAGDYLPSGLTNLGTDLSDDHPISFAYTAQLASADAQLVSPMALPPEIKLERGGMLQCTACHTAHDDRHGKFLARSNRRGDLCLSCHRMSGWNRSAHRSSAANVVPAGRRRFPTVAENACGSCHQVHAAGGHERLLIHEREEENCLACHDGRTARKNLLAELDKPSAHDPRRHQGRHDPREEFPGRNAHVVCSDCHNPHAVEPQPRVTGYIRIGATLSGAPGRSAAGILVRPAQFEYQVCFRCHAASPVRTSGRILRQSQTNDYGLKFSTSNPSFHPIVTASRAQDTISLDPTLSRGTLLRCTDCHNNDAGPRAGGTGPDGPHGSIHPQLLEKRYSVTDYTRESATEYALCYKCHRRSSILADESFSEHRRHVVNGDTPCSACHDPHGVSGSLGGPSDHTHLINFDTAIVFPERATGKIEFRDLGRYRGSCTLSCHGVNHVGVEYHR